MYTYKSYYMYKCAHIWERMLIIVSPRVLWIAHIETGNECQLSYSLVYYECIYIHISIIIYINAYIYGNLRSISHSPMAHFSMQIISSFNWGTFLTSSFNGIISSFNWGTFFTRSSHVLRIAHLATGNECYLSYFPAHGGLPI